MNAITINTKARTIDLSNTFAKAASIFGSEEYRQLQEARRDYPSYRVVTVKQKGTGNAEFAKYGFFTTYTGCILSGQIRKGSTYYDITDLIDKPIVGNSAGNLLAWTENNQLVAICPGYEKHFVSINSTTVYTLYITVLDVSGEIIMPESLIRIENDAFNSVPVQKVVISNKCVSIDSGAFAGSNCVVAFIPDSVESIAGDAFPDSLITVKTNSYNSSVTDWCDLHGIKWYVD